jgi:hypothetical protein
MGTFQCANCRQVINQGAVQCPYCHHNPFYAATMDRGTRQDSVASTPDTPFNMFLLIAFGAFVFHFAIWWLGAIIIVVGVYQFIKAVGRSIRGENHPGGG